MLGRWEARWEARWGPGEEAGERPSEEAGEESGERLGERLGEKLGEEAGERLCEEAGEESGERLGKRVQPLLVIWGHPWWLAVVWDETRHLRCRAVVTDTLCSPQTRGGDISDIVQSSQTSCLRPRCPACILDVLRASQTRRDVWDVVHLLLVRRGCLWRTVVVWDEMWRLRHRAVVTDVLPAS